MAINIGSLLIELAVNAGAFIEGMDKATYKAKQAAKEIGDSFKGIGKDLGGLLGQFGEIGSVIGDTLGSAGETISKVAGHLGSIGGAAGVAAIGITAVGAVAVAAAAGLGAMAIKGAEVVHQLSLVSQKTGIGIADLQVLQAAGSTVGLSLDQMTTGLRKFDQSLTGTGKNAGAAGIVLRQLGVTATDNTDALYQVADAFKNMQDGPRKAADAVALFGKSGLMMIPFLNKGADGIREFNGMVDQYGPKIGKDAVEANEAYVVSQTKLSLAWDSALVSAEKSFLPAITKGITGLADFTKSTGDLIDKLKVLMPVAEQVGKILATSFGHGYISDLRDKLASYSTDPGAPDTQKKSTDVAHNTASRVNNERVQQAELYYALAQKTGETELAYSYRNLDLLKQQRKIEDLHAAGKDEEATQESGKLKKLQDAADLENKQNALRRNPVGITPGKNPQNEISGELDDQITKQTRLAEAISNTKDAVAVYTAEENERIKTDKKITEITAEIAAQQIALKNAYKEPAKQSEIGQRINELKTFRDQLVKFQDLDINKAGAGALADQINKAVAGISDTTRQLETQAQAVKDVANAYSGGASAIRAAEIDKAVSKEAQAVKEAQDAYDKFIAKHGEFTALLAPEKTNLDNATAALQRSKQAAADIIDVKLAQHIREENDALAGNAAAWDIQSAAIGRGLTASLAAAEAAARAKAAADPRNTPEQVDLAGRQARQQALQGLDGSIRQGAASNDLTNGYRDQIAMLELIKKEHGDNAAALVIDNAKEKEALDNVNREWDQAALKVGTFGQRTAAVFNEIAEDGNNFWQSFAQAGLDAVNSLESALAKVAITGKGNFKQIAQSFGESTLTSGIKSITSKASSYLLDNTGLGGLLPGFGQAKADGSSEALALWVQVKGGALGSLPGGGNIPSDALGKIAGSLPSPVGAGLGLVGSLGSILGLPFLAGGGDVTPGQSYVVGEKHAEIFTPSQPGTISPSMSSGGAGGTTVNHFHFHGVTDADSFKRSQSQIAQRVTNTVGRANGRR